MILSLRYRLVSGLLRLLVRRGLEDWSLETAMISYHLKPPRQEGADSP